MTCITLGASGRRPVGGALWPGGLGCHRRGGRAEKRQGGQRHWPWQQSSVVAATPHPQDRPLPNLAYLSISDLPPAPSTKQLYIPYNPSTVLIWRPRAFTVAPKATSSQAWCFSFPLKRAKLSLRYLFDVARSWNVSRTMNRSSSTQKVWTLPTPV